MPSAETEVAPAASPAIWSDAWVAEVVAARPSSAPGNRAWPSAAGLALVVSGTAGSDLRIAEDPERVVLFAGVLTNAGELRPGASAIADAADLVAAEFRARGEQALEQLRGPFAIVVWNRVSGDVLAARDQFGIAPLFFARTPRGHAFSSSPDALVALPGVSRDFDAVALSEWLCGWYPAPEDTAFRAVKRVPAATAVTVSASVTSRRYWDPAPEDRAIDWADDDELARFEPLLTRAVARAISAVDGPSGLFLSGGLDSIAVALAGADFARASGRETPLALSLGFPEGESDESRVQSGVATELGLRQELVPFETAVGPRGLIAEALALNRDWPQPMANTWTPAYAHLGRLGVTAGIKAILTGRGGDEWIGITPYLFADLVARGDLAGVWRLIQVQRMDARKRPAKAMARLLWTTAGRSLASAALDRVAAGWWHEKRRERLTRERPEWVAPDSAVRAAMDSRLDRWVAPARPRQGFYIRESRSALTHPAVMHDLEETQEFGRRLGVRVLHPFWDVDLVSLLFRTRPETLIGDGQSKWLLRKMVAPRLPSLGLERRRKVSAQKVFEGIVQRQADAAWQALGGPASLGRLGVVDPAGVKSRSESGRLGGPGRQWTLLHLETWVRSRS